MRLEESISLLLPEGMCDYFDVIRIEKKSDKIIIELDEKNDPSKIKFKGKLLSKGFYEAVTIQDFPLRGRACFLKVRQRRWTVASTGEIVSNNWELTAKGTRLTTEFASFLKALNR